MSIKVEKSVTPDTRLQRLLTVRNLALVAAVSLFLLLAIIGLLSNNELDDQDSIDLLLTAEMFRSFDWRAILDLPPTSLPLYSFAVALFSVLTGEFEIAGRLVSLTSCLVTTITVYLIAKRFMPPWAGVAAVAILAVNPYWIRFSYSAVTEPMYVALFTWTLYYFIVRIRTPNARSGLVLGAIGGFAFYLRFESILLFTCLPILQFAYLRVAKVRSTKSDIAIAGIVYVLTFLILITPQVMRVSDKMNSFALNGRTAWQATLKTNDGRSYQEKIFGLDYDPVTTNIYYLYSHPEQLEKLANSRPISERIKSYAIAIARNLEELHADQITRLVGIPVLGFAVIGFLGLLKSAHAAESIVLLGYIGLGLAAPLVAGVDLDHIALIAPTLTMLAGLGVYDSINSISGKLPQSAMVTIVLSSSLLVAAVSPYPMGIMRLYVKPDDRNIWYDESAILGPTAAVRNAGAQLGRTPRVIAAHTYVAYRAEAEGSTAPWTDFDGLLHYMRVNRIDLLYVNKYLAKHPFIQRLDSPEWNDAFTLLYADQNESEGSIGLYRLSPSESNR